MAHICIVTEEFASLNSSGGIGTATRGLALHLLSLGHSVHVLITDRSFPAADPNTLDPELRPIRFAYLSDPAVIGTIIEQPYDSITKSYAVYNYLKGKNFAAVHFHEWQGCGFYVAMARRQGLFPSVVVTHLHGSSEWVRLHNRYLPQLPDFEREAIERSQIENSDHVICPSQYLLDWYKQMGVKLPSARQINWLLPQWMSGDFPSGPSVLTSPAIAPGQIKRLIFFGRHEKRKGFENFVAAVAQLPPGVRPDLLFLGRFDNIDHEYSGSYVFRKLQDYGGSIRFISDCKQQQAMSLLASATDALCVMPSLVENSPCTIGECLTLGISFLTTDVGGIPELVDPVSRAHCVVAPTAAALSNAIVSVVKSGMPPIVSTLSPAAIKQRWVKEHETILATEFASQVPTALDPRPLVSVCFTHYDRPVMLQRALDRILAQTYRNIEIIIVDDGSKQKASQDLLTSLENRRFSLPLKVIRSENRYLGAARNLGAQHAKGEFILFHDDDNLAEPHEIETLVKAALNSSADILTTQSYIFNQSDENGPVGPRRMLYYPIGIGGIFSFYRNRFGDANALLRRSVFQALGGFTELRGVGWEDWELFLKAYILGYKLGIVPEPLFHYRTSNDGMLATGHPSENFERLFAMVEAVRPKLGGDFFRYSLANHIHHLVYERTKGALANEKEGELHEKLTNEQPNSEQAIVLLSDLAFAIGRTADAIELAARIPAQRDKLIKLLPERERERLAAARRALTHTIEPSGRNDVLVLRGWSIDKSGAQPGDIDQVIIDGNWFRIANCVRSDRSDVRDALHLGSDRGIGFAAIATASAVSRVRQLLQTKFPFGAATGIGVFKVMPKSGKPIRGHIDDATWCQIVPVKAPDVPHWNGTLDIHTAAPAGVALRHADGSVDFGSRIDDCRTRFTVSGDQAKAMTAIVPSALRCDVVFGGDGN